MTCPVEIRGGRRRRHDHHRRALLVLLATLPILPATSAQARAPASARLTAFSSCGQFVRYVRHHAERRLAPSLERQRRAPAALPMPPSLTPMGGPVESPRAGDLAEPDHSGTNVQEAGVDEPDVVKVDASRMFIAVDGRLRAVDLRGGAARAADDLELPGYGHELLLHGDSLVVIANDYTGRSSVREDAVDARTSSVPLQAIRPKVHLLEVDVADPSALRVVRSIVLDGSYMSARANGAIARIVLSTPSPSPPFSSRDAIRRARWLRPATFHDRVAGRRSRRALTGCRQVRRPGEFAGLDMLTVLTFDLARGLVPVDSDAVMTDGEVVYGSRSSLYVAIEGEGDSGEQSLRTTVHRFAAGDQPTTDYRASGSVPGWLLNQFALSEHEGVLRVATTEEPVWAAGEDEPEAESTSTVTVLAERDGRLARIGRLGDLGRGESIHAVRFLGDVGFVVTFRQTDPLYALDLADPRAPRLAGELKIPGYSAYLHPVGDGLLLGIGQDATAQGRVTGSQVSLFDVSDPRRPVRLAQRRLGSGSSSDVEYDHRAFLFWAPTRLAVLPLIGQDLDGAAFAGAVGVRVDRAGGIQEVGRISQATADGHDPVLRTVVHGSHVHTVSIAGLRTSDLDTLAPEGWLPFR